MRSAPRPCLAIPLAVLMGSSCGGGEPGGRTTAREGEAIAFQSYDYGLELEHPADWTVFVSAIDAPLQAIDVHPADGVARDALPLKIHAPAELSHVGLYPYGWGTELPTGASRRFVDLPRPPAIGFSIEPEASRVFELADGEAWGWFLRPESPPASWLPEGYVFAQAAVADFATRCFDAATDEPKSPRACDPMMGDRVERHGTLDAAARDDVLAILASITFTEDPARDLTVHRPRPHDVVRSPLRVQGLAPGGWFFEGIFPIELVDGDGERIASAAARSHGDWMTPGLVPFSAVLEFARPAAADGELVLRNDNPSGLPEKAERRTVPVRFAPAG